MATRNVTNGILVLVFLVGCEGSPSDEGESPEEQLALFIEANVGRAPIQARVEYPEGVAAPCSTPSWTETHPAQPERDWPAFHRMVPVDVVATHPLLDTSRAMFVVGENFVTGIESEEVSVLMVTTWGGNAEIQCGEDRLSDSLLAIHVWLPVVMPADAAFSAASDQADTSGLVPAEDLDVAIEIPFDQ